MMEHINMCEVVQDLLPLYEDGCCSRQSRELVEAHLETCEACRRLRTAYGEQMPDTGATEEEDVQGIRKGLRIFVRWRPVTWGILALLLTVVFLVIPVRNHVRGVGLTYGKLGAVYTACRFEKALASGDYEKAYEYLDMKFRYEDLMATVPLEDPADPDSRKNTEAIAAGIREAGEKGFSWYDEVCRDTFLQNMRTLEQKNERICSCSDLRVERQASGWRICLDVRTDAGTDLVLWMDIFENRIRDFSASVNSPEIRGIMDSKEEGEGKMYEVLYRTPSVNETVLELLYGDTDYEWRMLFSY